MNTKTNILNALAIAASITLTATVAMAHSDHDHSTVPYKWEMSKDLKGKVKNVLQSGNPNSLIGLSHFEQKKLNHYAIETGNKFETNMDGYNFLIERTSAGMKIVGINQVEKVAYMGKVPIQNANGISNASMNTQSHTGHNHAQLPYEWTFGISTQQKIVRTMYHNNSDIYVGLNKFEQSLLKEYDIKSGNTFQTTIGGHKFMVEKTSSGIKVIDHMQVDSIAMTQPDDKNL
jgi:hypothetical protein